MVAFVDNIQAKLLFNSYRHKYNEDEKNSGTRWFTSINSHLAITATKRDDLESLGYIFFFFFLEGNLPWRNEKSWIETLRMKKEIPPAKMCESCPIEFIMFLNYSRGLRFDEVPDYDYLRRLFRDLAKKHGIVYDWKFDWLK